MELTAASVVNGNQVTYPNRFAIDDFKAMGVDWVAGQDVVTIENGKVTRVCLDDRPDRRDRPERSHLASDGHGLDADSRTTRTWTRKLGDGRR